MSARFVGTLGNCLGIWLLACSVTVQAAEKRLDRTFTVAPGGRLTIDSDGSDLHVEGTAGNEVVVHVLMTGSQRFLERATLSAEQSGNDVAVVAGEGSGIRLTIGWSQGSKVEVQVPRSYNVDIRATGGNIRAEQIEGSARLEISDGNIDVKGMTGDLDAKTFGGHIHLNDISGSVVARSSDGEIVAGGIRGDSELRTTGGNIRATIDGRITAQTADGDLTAELVGANRGISVSTLGGDLTVRVPNDTAAELDASAMGGSVRTELPVTTTETGEHKLTGTLNGGGNTIYARASDGNVKVVAAALR